MPKLPPIQKDTKLPVLPPLQTQRWATLYGESGSGVSTVALELSVFLASQYRVVLLRAVPRKGVIFSSSPRNNWFHWAKQGGILPTQGNFMVVLPAPVKRVGSPAKLARTCLPTVKNTLDKALQKKRLDFVIVDGGESRGAVWDIIGRFPGTLLVSTLSRENVAIRNRWLEEQPPGQYGSIPDLPALAAACAKEDIPMVYASGTMKRAFWELATNLFATR